MRKTIVLAAILFQIAFVACKENKSETLISDTEISTDSLAKSDVPEEVIIADSLIQEKNEASSEAANGCFDKSTITLPYAKKINSKTAVYSNLNCEVSGVSKFLCDSKTLRYIAFPDYKNVKVILVPMDCGDFSYRYFLLTVLNKKVVSNQYVEGEWTEPGDDTYKEITAFTIDSNYKITIKTDSVENGQTSLKEQTAYQLGEDGKLTKA